ncbi:nuclease-related domain-containing protein [Cellulomonas sp. WB94]|uniref:nuclease-related domain-containing protein n=1 Tax=Cellulomonas sp. WB94 TaxID=2173174 RepID=UPI001F5B0B2D|nr:nuclease-related domain-containing protein [Cellulomonas sp. WB94]
MASPYEEEPEIVAGRAGASARREYERRSAKREERVRAAHPKIGGFLLAISEEPQSTTAWAVGARGEALLGRSLDGLASRGVRVLHDRRIPRTRANIDHIAVSSSGVFVIDAKRYSGRPMKQSVGGLFRPRVTFLTVAGRNQTKLVDGVHKQVGLVRDALDDAGFAGVPVRGMLCFIEANWPLIGGSFVIDGVDVLWPKKAAELLLAPGGLDEAVTAYLHRTLATAFPAA